LMNKQNIYKIGDYANWDDEKEEEIENKVK
jgi:hypothetical protein